MAKKNPESMWPLYVLGGAVLGAGLYYLLKKNSVLAAPPTEVNLPLGEGDEEIPASVDSAGMTKAYTQVVDPIVESMPRLSSDETNVMGSKDFVMDQWGKPVLR